MRPLDGIRIVDMTTVLMGPYATQILGDMGADIIKVEAPEGDIVRKIGPGRNPDMGGMFLTLNRSKRSIALDLKKPEGQGILFRMVKDADVLIYNVRPQAMARLGLSYENIAKQNPKIIYAGVFGYGERGPYAGQPAYDDLIQGVSGISALMAEGGDGTPRYAPIAIADRMVGLFAVNSVLGALYARDRTGRGQRIDVPMFETMASLVLGDHMSGLTFEPRLDHGGYRRLLSRHRRPYRTSDGYVCAVIYNDHHWKRFFSAIGSDWLATDPRFQNHSTRTAHIDAIYEDLSRIFLTRTTSQWIALLNEADIPVTPMHDLESLLEDPHLQATGLISVVEHPTEGPIRSLGFPGTWSDTQPEAGAAAPLLGQHTRQILHDMCYSAAEIETFHTNKIAFGPPAPDE